MNYNTIFAPTAAIARAYNRAQDWIANEAPVIEQKIHNSFWLKTGYAATAALWLIDKAIAELDKADEYEIRLRLYIVKAKRSAIRRAISAYSFITYNGIDKKVQRFAVAVRKAWANRATIARATMDRIFCLG